MARRANETEVAEKANIAEQKAQLESGNFPEGVQPGSQGNDQSEGARLEDVINEGKEIKAGGKTFIVRKWVLKDYLRLSQLLLDLNLDFDKMRSMNIDANFIIDLLIMKAEIVVKIMAYTIKEDILFVENLDLDEAAQIGIEIWLNNQETFFRMRAIVAPILPNNLEDQQTQESPQQKEA